MKDALVTLAFAAAIFLALVIQDFIPPLALADGARVTLIPVLVCYAACVLPFASMLALAFLAGFLSDFAALQVVQRTIETSDLDAVRIFAGTVELSAGWSILFFVAVGLICQGLRPLVLRGHWWLPPLMSAAATFVYLALQFAVITMRRFDDGGLFWSGTVAWRLLAPAGVAFLLTLGLGVIYPLATGRWGAARRPSRDYLGG